MERITRLIPHTDSHSITLLFQKNSGLDVLSPTGEWIRAPALDDHILINIGDALQFWSGNLLLIRYFLYKLHKRKERSKVSLRN
jgi:isopenicillin N synthase-like dioxygenase